MATSARPLCMVVASGEAADKHSQLHAVCVNAPQQLDSAVRPAADLCGLLPVHLAAAMGRDECLSVLFDIGVHPSPWTAPARTASRDDDGGGDGNDAGADAGGAGEFASYESVCSSAVYRELKALVPPTSAFAHTFALAQILLRTPCTPLMLAVRFGRHAAAHTLLQAAQAREQGRLQREYERCQRSAAACSTHHPAGDADLSAGDTHALHAQAQQQQLQLQLQHPASPACRSCHSECDYFSEDGDDPQHGRRSLRFELSSALGMWSASTDPCPHTLRLLLGAGADPLHGGLQAMLQRYSGCSQTSALAGKMRAGLAAVLAQLLPLPGDAPFSAEGQAGGAGISGTDPHAAEHRGGDSGRAADHASASSEGLSSGLAAGSHGGADASGTSHPGSPDLVVSPPPGHERLWGSAQHMCALLAAAVACRDGVRCDVLLSVLESDSLGASPWLNPAANASLLVAATAHDLSAVVHRLLALPPAVPGGTTPPFQPNMWGEDGLSALMAAAHRGATGAVHALLAAGATANLADELGATALHWAVVGNSEAAVMLLAQHGANVDQVSSVHEEEEHLERPLLTATHAGNLAMMRLLHQLGASLDAPTPGGYTPLSVAVCWEQQDAARLLLSLGADPNQVLPPHVNGGFYQLWSENYSVEESRTLLSMACSRLDWAEWIELLLESGADPSLRHPQTGQTPAAEAASFGGIEEAAHLLELTAMPAGAWTLDQLGWADAMAEAASQFYFYSCSLPGNDASLEPLLDVWRNQQPAPTGPPPPAACQAIVRGLLRHSALTLRQGLAQLAAGAELAGVMQAERLASVGISADLLDECLEASPCKAVVLAAAPPTARWSPLRNRHFPPAFKRAAHALLLANHRMLGPVAACTARWDHSDVPSSACALGPPHAPGSPDYHRLDSSPASCQSSARSDTAARVRPAGLPWDAVFEVLRQLAAFPLSFWMRQPVEAALEAGGTAAGAPSSAPTPPAQPVITPTAQPATQNPGVPAA